MATESFSEHEISGKHLTFHLAEETYGLEILKVQEIIGIVDITTVPRMPDYMRGVINLRGKVLPVVDLRLKFGMDSEENTEKTCIVVAQVSIDDNEVTMGLVVDEVCEVLDIESQQIEPPPSVGASVNMQFIMGMGKIGENVVMLLDINKVFSVEDVKMATGVQETETS